MSVIAGRFDPADAPVVARGLRMVLAAVDQGEVSASPVMVARLCGALDVLDALARPAESESD